MESNSIFPTFFSALSWRENSTLVQKLRKLKRRDFRTAWPANNSVQGFLILVRGYPAQKWMFKNSFAHFFSKIGHFHIWKQSFFIKITSFSQARILILNINLNPKRFHDRFKNLQKFSRLRVHGISGKTNRN